MKTAQRNGQGEHGACVAETRPTGGEAPGGGRGAEFKHIPFVIKHTIPNARKVATDGRIGQTLQGPSVATNKGLPGLDQNFTDPQNGCPGELVPRKTQVLTYRKWYKPSPRTSYFH